MGPVEQRIVQKLTEALQPTHLEVENESHKHSVPAGSETHFRVFVVSARFENMTRIARQRLVNEVLVKEIAPGGVHALAQRAMTPDEWDAAGGKSVFTTPDCAGGSKHDKR